MERIGSDDEHTRSEYDWNAQVQRGMNSATFSLVNKQGKVIRPGLTQRAAVALQSRPDLIKKYGPLFVKRQ